MSRKSLPPGRPSKIISALSSAADCTGKEAPLKKLSGRCRRGQTRERCMSGIKLAAGEVEFPPQSIRRDHSRRGQVERPPCQREVAIGLLWILIANKSSRESQAHPRET